MFRAREFDSVAEGRRVTMDETAAVSCGCWTELRVYSLVYFRRFNYFCAPLLCYSHGILSIVLKPELPTPLGWLGNSEVITKCALPAFCLERNTASVKQPIHKRVRPTPQRIHRRDRFRDGLGNRGVDPVGDRLDFEQILPPGTRPGARTRGRVGTRTSWGCPPKPPGLRFAEEGTTPPGILPGSRATLK